jgi:hypothetical protein
MGIAADSSFVYLAADHGGLNRGGSSGDSRLYIGQILTRQDLADGDWPFAVKLNGWRVDSSRECA